MKYLVVFLATNQNGTTTIANTYITDIRKGLTQSVIEEMAANIKAKNGYAEVVVINVVRLDG